MGDIKTTIELNGKKYDARTGKIIGESTEKIQPLATSVQVKVVDGFVRRPSTHKNQQSSAAAQTPKPSTKAPLSDHSVNHAKRPLAKSKTLMRPVVKKPILKNDVQKPKFTPKVANSQVLRVTRAQNIEQSPLITKFGKTSLSSTVQKSSMHLPLVSPPNNSNGLTKTLNSELSKFEESIKNATAHMQKLEQETVKKLPFLKRVGFKNQFANLATMSAAFMLLGGFFLYQNTSYVSMKMAASKAGISAKMPRYTPAGFNISNNVSASDGKVTISFRSNTDDRNYAITQQASEWNSSSLLASYVTKQTCDSCYQSWSDTGKTIYTYNSNATWVDGGIWYTVEGNSNLTSDQLQRIANSL